MSSHPKDLPTCRNLLGSAEPFAQFPPIAEMSRIEVGQLSLPIVIRKTLSPQNDEPNTEPFAQNPQVTWQLRGMNDPEQQATPHEGDDRSVLPQIFESRLEVLPPMLDQI